MFHVLAWSERDIAVIWNKSRVFNLCGTVNPMRKLWMNNQPNSPAVEQILSPQTS